MGQKCRRSKNITFAVCYFCVIFQSNEIVLTLETHFDKLYQYVEVTMLGAESPAAGGQWGFEGGTPGCCSDFTAFPKKYLFLGIFWPKFLLKNLSFKCLNKVSSLFYRNIQNAQKETVKDNSVT